jgi:hypothetical protein
MTDNTTPVAGWYPDPAGQGRIQWWDGSQWTDNFAEPAAPAQQQSAPAYGASQPHAAQPQAAQPYSAADPYNVMAQKVVAPEGTPPYNPFIWGLAALPVVSLIVSIVTWFSFDDQIDAALQPDAPLFTPADLVSYAVSFIVAAVSILLGFLDYRALVRAGVPKPFHWAFVFFALVNAPVYIIGRSVVVRRRTGRGLAPMFVHLGLWVATFLVGIVFAAIAIGPIFDQMSQTGY